MLNNYITFINLFKNNIKNFIKIANDFNYKSEPFLIKKSIVIILYSKEFHFL